MSHKPAWLAGWAVLLLPLFAAATSRAQQASALPAAPATQPTDAISQAREHFQKGVAYYAEGDLTAALVEFQRAYALQPTYRLLYNLGQVSYELRDYAAAEQHFRDYLEQGGSEIAEARRSEVAAELEGLHGRVADLQLRTNLRGARFYVDDQAVGSAPLFNPIRVSAGRRRIRAESARYAPVSRVIDVVGGEALLIELAFAAPLDGARAASSRKFKPALWTGIATGALALGTAGMAYWAHSEDQAYADALQHRTTRSKLDSLADSTRSKALIADILLGTTLVGAALTTILLLGDEHPKDRHEPGAATLQLGPGSLRGSF
jgi:tetratricopeptide (TPR) repeat protein